MIPAAAKSNARSIETQSALETQRAKAIPAIPDVLRRGAIRLEVCHDPEVPLPDERIRSMFPNIAELEPLRSSDGSSEVGTRASSEALNVGIASVSNAVAASGVHNVILGLGAFLEASNSSNRYWGIRNLTKGDEFLIGPYDFAHYLNQAGGDLLPSVPLSRVTDRLLTNLSKLCVRLKLHGLVFMCGPSELSEVAKISQQFGAIKSETVIVAIVHSLSGWVQIPRWMPTNLGFDSASSVLAEAAGNISLSREGLFSDVYHFVACGSSPLTLEVVMQIQSTLCFMGVALAQSGLKLQDIVDEICDVIVDRHHKYGLHSGLITVSDDFFEQLVEMRNLREEVHKLRLEQPADMRSEESAHQFLSPESAAFFSMLPADVKNALIFRTGMDGKPVLVRQDPERELGALVARCLRQRAAAGQPSVANFKQQLHSLRHLAWSPMPTQLDCSLGYSLGHVAGELVRIRNNGYVASMGDLDRSPEKWTPCAIPMVRILEPGSDDGVPVPKRRRLTPDDKLCSLWRKVRGRWRYQQSCRQPGPPQHWGPGAEHDLAWKSYTLRAVYGDIDELARDSGFDGPSSEPFCVPISRPCSLMRRSEACMSPLQKWRLSYQPSLPWILQGPIKIEEDHRKGTVCADHSMIERIFPSLCQTDNLKAIKFEPKAEETSVLQMIPEEPPPKQTFDMLPRDSSSGSITGECFTPEPRKRNEGVIPPANSNVTVPRSDSNESLKSPLSAEKAALNSGFPGRFQPKPVRVAIAILGKPGPGLNNLIMGVHEYLNNPERQVPGVVICIPMGIAGLSNGYAFELEEAAFALHRNQGGCDFLGRSDPGDLLTVGEDLSRCAKTARDLRLDGLVLYGGRNVHAWTARLAEFYAKKQISTRIVAVPASTQSDLPLVEQTLGYDTVCKLYAAITGNLATQTASSGNLWCFTRIPGRSISHIAAEVALETHPHVLLMASNLERDQQQLGLTEVTQLICNVIEKRSHENKHYGVVLIPDQFLASVREMRCLFEEIDEILQACPETVEALDSQDFSHVLAMLPPLSRALFQGIPGQAKVQILSVIHEGGSQKGKESLDLSSVETECIFKSLVEAELTRRVVLGTFKGTFRAITYALPYHGRAAMPTNFDCDLGYTLGWASGLLIDAHKTGLLVEVSKLKEDVKHWEVRGTPLTSLLSFQDPPAKTRIDYYRPKIGPKSRLHYDIGLDEGRCMPDPVHRTLVSPGPSQFAGPCANIKTQSLKLPQLQRVRQMERAEQLIQELKTKASAGCPPDVLNGVKLLLQGGVDYLRQL